MSEVTTLEPEVQPNAEAEPSSEPDKETTSAPEPEVIDETADAVFAELGLGDAATDKGNETTPAADGTTEADPYAGLTPQEIAKKVREDVEAETNARVSSKEYQNYVAGVSRAFQSTDADLQSLASEWNLSIDQANTLRQKFASFKGHYDVLYGYGVETEKGNLTAGMKQALIAAAASVGVKDAAFSDARDFVAKVAEASRNGHLSEAQVKTREREAVEKGVKAYRKKLIEKGVDIPGIRQPEVPNNPGTGGGSSFRTSYENDKAFHEGRITPQQWKANDERFKAQEK